MSDLTDASRTGWIRWMSLSRPTDGNENWLRFDDDLVRQDGVEEGRAGIAVKK